MFVDPWNICLNISSYHLVTICSIFQYYHKQLSFFSYKVIQHQHTKQRLKNIHHFLISLFNRFILPPWVTRARRRASFRNAAHASPYHTTHKIASFLTTFLSPYATHTAIGINETGPPVKILGDLSLSDTPNLVRVRMRVHLPPVVDILMHCCGPSPVKPLRINKQETNLARDEKKNACVCW